MIPEDKVAEIRERAAILEVVADYVSLKRSGANYQGLCPFHGEKTPSFNVNPGRGIFHCFGCGEGGNVFAFIMKMEGVSFPEAVKLLAKRVGIVIDEQPLSGPEKRRQDERELLERIAGLAAAYYARILQKDAGGEAGRRYLQGRGVPAEIIEPYRLGFATDRWDGLAAYLEQHRVPLETAEKLGLIRKRSSGGGFYDLFRNRLIFTIANAYGQPIAFGGRVLDASLPKYINSPESPIYHKSEVLFGVDLAKQAMRETKAAIIVEGYFDHLALYQAGVRNVLASCGTALTAGHVQLLKRYADKVYLLFDADNAGKKATFRAMELLLDAHLPAFVVELPAGDDPDSFLRRESRELFLAQVEKARPVLDFYLRDLLQRSDTGSVAGKVAAIDAIVPLLQKLTDPVEQDLYLREVARLLAVELRTLQRKLGQRVSDPTSPAKAASAERRVVVTPEETLLLLMGRYPEVVSQAQEYGLERLFSAELLPLARMIAAAAADGIDWSLLLEQVELPELRQRLAALIVNDTHLEEVDPAKAVSDCCRAVEKQNLQQHDAKALRQELARLDSDSPRYWEILRDLDALRNRKSQLL
jgi:DNA primase